MDYEIDNESEIRFDNQGRLERIPLNRLPLTPRGAVAHVRQPRIRPAPVIEVENLQSFMDATYANIELENDDPELYERLLHNRSLSPLRQPTAAPEPEQPRQGERDEEPEPEHSEPEQPESEPQALRGSTSYIRFTS